jgi:hypothetical protein
MTLSEQYPLEMLPVRVIRLTQGKFALVDPDDPAEPWLVKWCATRNRYKWYAVRNAGDHRDYLHRLLMGDVERIDHRNGNGLDNRRCNLRSATNSQNMANGPRPKDNTSGHQGVVLIKRTGGWQARAGKGSGGYVGYYKNFDDAVAAYHAAMEVKYGEFAPNCCVRREIT